MHFFLNKTLSLIVSIFGKQALTQGVLTWLPIVIPY
jgi:hypothetical protein